MRVLNVKVDVETRVLNYIKYELEHDGSVYYRVVKLVRLLRNPREYAQIETALEIHRDFIALICYIFPILFSNNSNVTIITIKMISVMTEVINFWNSFAFTSSANLLSNVIIF